MMTMDVIIASFAEPNFWHWFTAAIVLFVFELLLPTTFLMWIGIGAFFTGLITFVNPQIDWSIQLIIFAVFTVASIIVGKRWLNRRPIETDEPLLNRRAEQYLGRVVTLPEPMVNGVGHVSIDDTRWKVEGPDLDTGERIRVVAMKGSSLQVEHFQED